MKLLNTYKHYITITFLVAILLLGLFLRHYNYRAFPRHGATFDEFAWTWLGINLIQKGVPVSWSSQPQYANKSHLVYQGAAFWIVTPYLEHPPFFGLISGGVALLNGAKDMYDVTLAAIRPLALFLGVLSVFFVFLLTKELYGKKIALLSSLIYATVPTTVIGSRIVQNENFMIPMWLISLYLLHKYLKSGRTRFRNAAAIVAGILSISKVPWLVVGFSLSLILSYKSKWRDAITVGFIVLAVFSLYILYGIYFYKNLFLNLWRLQTARYDISFIGFYSVFIKPLLVDRFFLDGWIFFGWFSIFLLSRDFKKHFMILIPFLSYLLIYVFAIPDEPMHGWYRYPFYPFLLISSAFVLKDEFQKISLVSLFFIILVGLSLFGNYWTDVFGFSYFIYRLFIIAAFGTIFIFYWKKKYARIASSCLAGWFLIFIILNILTIVNYIE